MASVDGNNNAETLEDRVLSFTAAWLGVKRSKVVNSTRLAQDRGMDGDDAVEFFREFGEKFTVDLHGLYANWERHFLPEGGSGGLTTIAVICGCITAGFMLKDFVGVLPAWGWGIVLIGIATAIHQKWFTEKDTRMLVKVSDLIESARSSKWSILYPTDSWRDSSPDEHITRLKL